MNLPASNLPPVSVPWGRSVEEELEDAKGLIVDLGAQVNLANQTIQTQSSHLTELQNYIREICRLSGLAYPPAAIPVPPTPPAPTPETPPAKVPTTKEFNAVWSATWWQGYKRTAVGGTNDDKNSLYQRGSGYTFSMWRFDIGPARGKNITAVQMLLTNVSTYYNGAFTAILGTHGQVNEPGNRQGRENGFDVGWTAGEGKWIDIPSWAYGALSNGSIQGFTMGDNTAETRNFARFNGVGRNGAPVLRVTYDA